VAPGRLALKLSFLASRTVKEAAHDGSLLQALGVCNELEGFPVGLYQPIHVMAGLDPAIHEAVQRRKSHVSPWYAALSYGCAGKGPRMTAERVVQTNWKML
jgi:hypothetical protein